MILAQDLEAQKVFVFSNSAASYHFGFIRLQHFQSSESSMASVGPRVAKDEFMTALGLNANNTHHEQYYRAMRVGAPIVRF